MRSSDQPDGHGVYAGRIRAPVSRDPAERHDQRRRVMHEIEHVIKPAARVSRRPTVKLGLHPRYPRPPPHQAGLGLSSLSRKVAALAAPSPRCHGSRRSIFSPLMSAYPAVSPFGLGNRGSICDRDSGVPCASATDAQRVEYAAQLRHALLQLPG
jgi:hypothetical protein